MTETSGDVKMVVAAVLVVLVFFWIFSWLCDRVRAVVKRKLKAVREAEFRASMERRDCLHQKADKLAEAAAASAPAMKAAARRERRPRAPQKPSKAAPAPLQGYALPGVYIPRALWEEQEHVANQNAFIGMAKNILTKDRIVEDEDDPDYVDFLKDLRFHKEMGLEFKAVEDGDIMWVTLSNIEYSVQKEVYWRAVNG